MKEKYKGDSFAELIGVELLEVSKGTAKAKIDIKKRHLNIHNTVHGGAIFTLADTVFAAASNSHNAAAMAININISYIKAATEGTLYAEAREISLNRKLATYSISVTNEKGELIADFQGMAYRKEKRSG
ncbi:MAG: PaaI family thioesterase [Desulfobacterales bacterium]|jgi:acyl-CoA thioesterase|nr:PaaI family thioesterase [Desulfobacteraceae bacterium]MBT4364744.1 PaaI family thioesterase [Desulfobacteraceae bacterium]MBT7086966.1 PaaI family thioesterase [Desulfobacterales bacterium]